VKILRHQRITQFTVQYDCRADFREFVSAVSGTGGGAGLSKIKCVYFEKDNVFEEVEHFITETEQKYGLEIVRFRGSFKEGCDVMVQRYQTKAFLLGACVS